MRYLYFDASAGASGDMILGALLDLGVPRAQFLEKMAELRLPVEIGIRTVKRAGLRGIKVDVRVKKGKESRPRHWSDIEALIRKSPFSNSVKANSLAVFGTLFKAEARVHGEKFQTVHLHEAGADDALVDVIGSSFLAESLGVRRVFCSPLNVGSGWVKTSHGVLPVPPPAVAEILKDAPVYSAWAEEELVTPTGAAILSTWTEAFIPFPETSYSRIGCGAGSRDFEGLPNILRVFCGEEKEFRAEKEVYQVEANLDDSSPQLLAQFLEKALRLGALDAFLTPVTMKKGRLGSKLTLLADAATIDALIEAVFRETSSIGVRYFPVERRVLQREIRKVRVSGEAVGIKVAALGESEVNVQPEFSDCLRVAEKKGLPVKRVLQLALMEYFKEERKKP
ncbi:MAG TPA: nickel pincer cofactor biosynthesis protein LarC [Candidatus Aminicenantes bacterium]|nr:nickel pincer cofactor biosynthesis protein LarC [Candidatus Aminicenantes bacterium]